VRSSINDSFEGANEATYEFVINTPLWKRYWFIALCVLVGGGIIYLYVKARERRLRNIQLLKQEKIQFQFQVLRNQINPHFLFNSFNTLISTIEDNPKMAVSYVEHLSEFFRNIVNYRDTDVISVGEELTLMETYFYLQQKRFGDHLRMEVNIAEETKKHTFIPPLTLQLLMENAIKHNAVSKEAPLLVDLVTEGDYIIVRNNINLKRSREASSGMGLQNIVNRYNLLTKEPVTIANDGKHFTVSLPTLKQE
jgi:LytS/YehU family sensor histidine kinase